jgi:hypothetical protein
MLESYKNFLPSKPIIPSLAIPIERSRPKDPDILSAPFPERDGILERVVEVVVLPVSDIVRELLLFVSLHR